MRKYHELQQRAKQLLPGPAVVAVSIVYKTAGISPIACFGIYTVCSLPYALQLGDLTDIEKFYVVQKLRFCTLSDLWTYRFVRLVLIRLHVCLLGACLVLKISGIERTDWFLQIICLSARFSELISSRFPPYALKHRCFCVQSQTKLLVGSFDLALPCRSHLVKGQIVADVAAFASLESLYGDIRCETLDMIRSMKP